MIPISLQQSCLVGLSFQHRRFDTLFGCWIMKQPIVRRFWWILKDGEPSIFKLWMNVTTKTEPAINQAETNTVSLYTALWWIKILKKVEIAGTNHSSFIHWILEFNWLLGLLTSNESLNSSNSSDQIMINYKRNKRKNNDFW